MTIINKPITEIIPYANNPRKNGAAVDKVAASIKEFGFKVPIIIGKDNVIVTGHTRLLAAQKLGLETVPCVIADDLTPAQRPLGLPTTRQRSFPSGMTKC